MKRLILACSLMLNTHAFAYTSYEGFFENQEQVVMMVNRVPGREQSRFVLMLSRNAGLLLYLMDKTADGNHGLFALKPKTPGLLVPDRWPSLQMTTSRHDGETILKFAQVTGGVGGPPLMEFNTEDWADISWEIGDKGHYEVGQLSGNYRGKIRGNSAYIADFDNQAQTATIMLNTKNLQSTYTLFQAQRGVFLLKGPRPGELQSYLGVFLRNCEDFLLVLRSCEREFWLFNPNNDSDFLAFTKMD